MSRPIMPIQLSPCARSGYSHQTARATTTAVKIQPSTLIVVQLAEEMRLLVAGELGEEIVEPHKAEAQAVGGELHPAQREDDGIEGREDREDQDQDHGRRDEESARVVVHPFAPARGP